MLGLLFSQWIKKSPRHILNLILCLAPFSLVLCFTNCSCISLTKCLSIDALSGFPTQQQGIQSVSRQKAEAIAGFTPHPSSITIHLPTVFYFLYIVVSYICPVFWMSGQKGKFALSYSFMSRRGSSTSFPVFPL